MACMTGSGANLTATGFLNRDGSAHANSAGFIALVAALDIENMQALTASIPVLDAPRLKDAVGTTVRKCFGDAIDHDGFIVNLYHEPTLNLLDLIGVPATYTRTHQDGSSWTGTARVVTSQPMPTEEVNVLSKSQITIQFDTLPVLAPA